MKVYFIVFFIIFSSKNYAQNNREIIDEEQVWLAYFSQIRLTNKYGIWIDGHYRTSDHILMHPSKLITRLGLIYYINDHLKFTNGYTYIHHYPDLGHLNIAQPEHRIWHQIQYQFNLGKIRSMQWLRLEERFRRKIKNDDELGDGYRFDFRLRTNLMFNFPLSRKGVAPKTFSGILNNEFFINFKNNSNPNYFLVDQNRFFAGLSYNITNHSNIQIGYMNIFQQLIKGSKFRNTDAVRFFYFQNFDLREKK